MAEFFNAIGQFFTNHGYTIEIIIPSMFFGSLFERRKHDVLYFIFFYGILLAFSTVWSIFIVEKNVFLDTAKYLIMVGLSGICVFACKKIRFLGAVYCMSGAQTSQHLAFCIYSVILSLTNNVYGTPVSAIITIAVEAMVYVLIFLLFIKRIKDQDKEYYENKLMILIALAIIFFTLIFHFVLDGIVDMHENKLEYIIFTGYAAFCCVFVMYLMYGVFRTNKLNNDMAVLDHLVHMQEEQYRMNKKSMEMINIKCHDIKQQLSKYGNRMSEEEMKEIRDLVNIYDSNLQTGNEVLDVFLAEKSLICERNGIIFDCIADGTAIDFMKISDIYALFGNLIDNAIEAVSKLENKEQKTVSMKITKKLGMVLIHMENYYSGEIKFENGFPVTSKEDKIYHGFGMQSIKMIVHRYSGYVAFQTTNNVFVINISIPIPKTSQTV